MTTNLDTYFSARRIKFFSDLRFLIIKIFLGGFLTHIKYSIENWVWLCWESLAGARTPASVVAACNLTSSPHGSLSSSVDISQARACLSAATESVPLGGISHSTSCHPTVLASQVA